MNIQKDIVILQIIEDNDGEYTFLKPEECQTANIYNKAWERHQEFLETESGEDFNGEDAINSNPDDFIHSLAEFDVVVTANSDITLRRIYKLIRLTVDFKVDVKIA